MSKHSFIEDLRKRYGTPWVITIKISKSCFIARLLESYGVFLNGLYIESVKNEIVECFLQTLEKMEPRNLGTRFNTMFINLRLSWQNFIFDNPWK